MSNESSESSAPKPAVLTRRHRWRRRIIVALAILAVVSIIARVAVNIALPTVLRRIAAGYDLTCNYERSEMNLLSGDAGLWHLSFTPKSGGDPVLQLDYVRGNISTLALLRGRLDVWRMEADGVDVVVERTADGHVPLLEKLLANSTAARSYISSKSTGSTSEVNFNAPVIIDAFRLSHVRARIIDRTVSPPTDAMITLNARISDVQSTIRPITFEMDFWTDPVLDLLRVEGTARTSQKTLDAELHMVLHGFHPKQLAAYLTPFGVRPVASNISMEGTGQIKLVAISTTPPAPNTPPKYDAISGELSLNNIAMRTETEESVGVDHIKISANSIGFDAAKFGELLVEGVRVSAGATDQGAVRFAGFELASPIPSTNPSSAVVIDATPHASPSTQPFMKYHVALEQASLRKMQAAFQDKSVSPAAQISFNIDDLTAKNIAFDPNNLNTVIDIGGTMSAPSMAQAIVLSAKVAPFAPQKKTLTLSVNVDGIKPDAIKPYLDSAGFQSELRQGSFTAEINGELTQQTDGRFSASGRVTKLRFADGSDLLAMNDVKLDGIGIDPKTGVMRVEAIDISGPSIVASRNAAGEIAVAGFRSFVRPAKPAAPLIAPPTTSPSRIKLVALPKLQIGKFTWKDFKFQFTDEMVSPPASITLADAGVEINDLAVGATSNAESQKPGTIKAWISAPGLIQRGSVEGTMTALPTGAATDVQVSATGISANAIKPYLLALGVEPLLQDGQLQLHAKASINQLDDGIGASLNLEKVTYLDGTAELAGADAVRIQDVSVKPEGLAIGALELDRPRASVSRDSRGDFAAGGIKLLLARLVKSSTAAPSTQPIIPPIAIAAELKRFRISDGVLNWSDQTAAGSVNTAAHSTVALDGLTIGRAADPATFTITSSADGVMEHSQLTGKLFTSPDLQGIEMEYAADGVKIGPLAPYVPTGIGVSLREGKLHGVISAMISPNQQGGHSARISASDVSLADVAASPPLLKLDSFSAVVPRLDPEGGAIDIDHIQLAGFETDIHQTADGSLHLPGIVLLSEASRPPTTQAATIQAIPTTGPVQDVAALVAAAHRPPPLITLKTLDIGVSRISIQSDMIPGSAPLVLSHVEIKNIDQIQIGGSDYASRPPAQVELTGALDPMLDTFKIATKLSPLAQQPSAVIDVDLSGIHGDGLTKLLPQVQRYVDAAQLKAGELHTHLEMSGKFARHAPMEFDLTKPFDLDLQMTGTAYHAEHDGPVLAGLDALHADSVHVDPATGSVQMKMLEITKPSGTVWREKDGIHAFGWVVKVPLGPDSAPTTAPASMPVVVEAAPTQAKKPQAEFRIDKVLISGLDFRIEDRSVHPPVVIPLNGLDVEVRNLSNMAMYEDRPIQFSALVTSGKATLPSIKKGNESATEEREVFSQVTATGKFSLYPQADGWAKASVNGFELASLRGLAHENDITLGKGIFDANIDLRFKPEGTIDVRSKLVLTDLQISEPAGGPIQRALVLPGTLDVVIKALQDPDESMNVPLNFPVKQGKLSGPDVTGAAIGALASVMATAVASAPVKAVGGVTDMIGIPGMNKSGQPQQPVELAFTSGAVDLDPQARQTLDQLMQQMKKDKNVELTLRHEMGGGDIAREQIRANPSIEECQNLAYQLRNRKIALLAQRSLVAGEARGTIAAAPNSPDAINILGQLRDLDRQIAQTEDALDRVYDLFKPGAELQTGRRTRAASLELAQQRLEVVKNYLTGLTQNPKEERVHSVNPTFTAPDDPNSAGKVVITIIAKKKE